MINQTGDIIQKIFFEPVVIGGNKLCILSNKVSPSMISWILKYYDEKKISGISLEVIITSVPENGISKIFHQGFLDLQHSFKKGGLNKFVCSYLYRGRTMNKNLYVWLKGEEPIKAFSFSGEFDQKSFLETGKNFVIEDASSVYNKFEEMVSNSIYCTNSEVEEYVLIGSSDFSTISTLRDDDPNYVTLSLVNKKTGEPGKRSGLNWGQRKNRNRNEAYIPLPRKIAKSGFFPLGKRHFLVMTDDHHVLQLRVEQQNDKAITTPASNAQLGEYFRNRLGLANGAYIHGYDLENYGRKDVSFYKIDGEQYYMDFSINFVDKINE